MNWTEILVPKYPLEMVLRGALAYLGLLLLIRVVLKRQSGSLAPSDLLVTVLIADAIQNGMAGEYRSVTDGLILVSTILGMDYLVDQLTFRFPWLRNLFNEPAVALVREGKMLRQNLRRELVTHDELFRKLREHGVESIKEVKLACLESDGEISVVLQSK